MCNSNNIVLFLFIFDIIVDFSRLNNKIKYFYIHSCIFLVLFSKRNECIVYMKIYSLLI